MHYSSTLTAALTLLLSTRTVSAGPWQAIIPYIDGQCNQPVKNYKLNGNTQPASIWDNTNGWPRVSRYSSPSFPGAEAKTGSGYNVYWKIANPDPTCRVAIMTPYSQQFYGSMSFAAPPGNVILMVAKAGCYFTSIPQGVDISATFCCGTGDCTPLTVGNSALLKREETSLSLFSRASAAVNNAIIPRRATNSLTGKAASYALEARNNNNLNPDLCKIKVLGGPNPQAGQQVMVADPQRCDVAPCTFAVSNGVTVSTSFSSSTDQTITDTVGGSIAIKTGVDFIAEADVTLTATYSLAKSVSHSTSTSITNSTTVTVTNTIGQQPGTYAFVTFTPTYLCWLIEVDCGAGISNGMHFCQPQMGSGGKLLEGDYTVVYTG